MRGRKTADVTIVIPFFNLGHYIDETVQSAMGQTLPPDRIIIVDDGSTDSTSVAALDRLAQSPWSVPIQVIRTPHRGLPFTRNIGVAACTTEFFVPLDADDTIDPTFIEKTMAACVSQDTGFVSTNTLFFGEGIEPYVYELWPFALDRCLIKNNSSATALVRKEAWGSVGGYDESMIKGYEDWDFWIRLGKKGWRAGFVSEALFHYRRRPDSMYTRSSGLETHLQLMRTIFEKHPDLVERFSTSMLLEQERELHYYRKVLRANRPERRALKPGETRRIGEVQRVCP